MTARGFAELKNNDFKPCCSTCSSSTQKPYAKQCCGSPDLGGVLSKLGLVWLTSDRKSQLDGEGTAEGYRQGIVIGIDPSPTGSIWVRNNRGRLVQVAREQLRGVEGEELWTPSMEDLKMLRSAEEDLSKKFAGAHDQRGPAPREHEDRLILDAAGEPQPQAEEVPPLLLPVLPLQDAAAEPAALPAPAVSLPTTPRTL